MASKKEYLDYVLGQLQGVQVTYKKMMGEYLLYVGGMLIGGVYDDRLLIKPTKRAKDLLPNAQYDFPYENAKPMIICDFVDDKEKLSTFINQLSN